MKRTDHGLNKIRKEKFRTKKMKRNDTSKNKHTNKREYEKKSG